MLFSSLEFLFLYILVCLPVYFLTPLKWRLGVLFAVSLIFYGWGEPMYVFLMLFTIAADYGFGLLVGKYRGQRKGKAEGLEHHGLFTFQLKFGIEDLPFCPLFFDPQP